MQQRADELIFLDITASHEKRGIMLDIVKKTAEQVFMPLTVGGGIRTVEDIRELLNAGADKISINTSAFKNPQLIKELSSRFGSQCIVLAIDTKFENGDWFVYLNGGKVKTEKKALDWAKEGVALGAGEILLTSMNNDGTKNGFANDITKLISENVNVPVIASGGAGAILHFHDAFTIGKADAALAASVFHFNEINIKTLKQELRNNKINVRL